MNLFANCRTFFCVVVLGHFVSVGLAQEAIPLHRDSVVRFATKAEGVKAVTKQDAFVKSLSRFDKQSRLGTDKPVTTEQYLAFVTKEVKEFDNSSKDRIRKTIEKIHGRFKPLQIPFPKEVLFVNTTGKEEGGAAYCRGNAVVLPDSLLARIGDRLEGLIVHELFHILSVANPELRDKLYKIVGFHRCQPISLLEDLKDRKITNPDAPTLTHYMKLTDNDKVTHIVPLLFASVPAYDPEAGGSFFKYLQFKLLVVEPKDGKFVVKQGEDKKSVMIDPKSSASFKNQIGNNTNYIYHADEILADNFVLLVMNSDKVKTPRIIKEMRALLSPSDSPQK